MQASRGKSKAQLHARTFEEALIYENLDIFRESKIPSKIAFASATDLANEYEVVFQHVASSSFKKTEFALDLLTSPHAFRTPSYIVDGLKWLEAKIKPAAMVQATPKKARKVAAK